MTTDKDAFVRRFVETFEMKDASRLEPFLHPEVVFRNYGEDEVHGRAAVLQLWEHIFATFEQVRFETVHQAVSADVVIAEQVHGLALPGRPLAPVMNMAVYEIRDGLIAAWRDYTNTTYAAQLVAG
ncbi:nuclear transport factor 2 family protein [Streptomyces chromofuscus]|uniref:Nuclear transport factor 2 family protein n=1 Tax=Streptomyces chromofuscus TaxID=42881 RepID=A0A7M2T7X4_STRCW|nr:nuclear transport factor 2 family protein [Streptomyces chromofuscus]QOV43521.1 nuclear transport factor 2 family protein [Streptomyces chromofuscus]